MGTEAGRATARQELLVRGADGAARTADWSEAKPHRSR